MAKSKLEPRFRFIQINDLHVQSSDPSSPPVDGYALANEKAEWLIDGIAGERFCPAPSFVIGAGDMIHGEVLERLEADTRTFTAMIERLPCPFYPAVGNHEVIQQERSVAHLKAYADAYGADRVNYSFVEGGIAFVVVNNGGGDDPANGAARRIWLEDTLEWHRKQPTIVVCHIPLLPLRERAVLARSFGFSSYCDADDGMLRLVEAFSENVVAVLSGHLHLTGMRRKKGIAHFSLSGSASYPSDGATVYAVFEDRIEAKVIALPPELANASPTLHGRPRHETDFIDSRHPQAQQYQCGNASERRFTIALPRH